MWGQSDNNQVNLTEPVVSEHSYEKYETAAAPRKRFDFITILKLCQFSGARGLGPGGLAFRRLYTTAGRCLPRAVDWLGVGLVRNRQLR